MNFGKLNSPFYYLAVFFLIIIGIFLFIIINSESRVIQAQEKRDHSYVIVSNVKSISEKLTHYCRLYALSGNTRIEEQYNSTYDSLKQFLSIQVSELVQKGFTKIESDKLKDIEKELYNLSVLQNKVFNLPKTSKNIPLKSFNLEVMSKSKYNVIYSDAYYMAEKSLFQATDNFFKIVRMGTSESISKQNKKNYLILEITTISVVLLLIVSIIISFLLRKKLASKLHELKLATNIVEESDKLFQMFMDRLPGLAYIKTSDTRVRFMNAGFSRYLNMDPKSNINKLANELFPPEFAKKIEEDDLRVLQTGNSELIEEQFADRYWMTHKFIIPQLNAKPLLGGITIDITEKKKVEENYSKLSRAVEQSSFSIVITDYSGNIEYVNQYFCKLTGYDVNEVVGKNPRLLKSGTHSSDVYDDLWKTILSGKEWRGEFYNRKKNGELYWEEASISPIFNNDGIITHFVAVKEDITQKKKHEQELYYEKTLLRTVIDNVPDLIYSKDIEARKTLSNKADLSIMGVNSETEALGKDDFAFFPYERAKEFYDEDMSVITTGNPSLDTEGSHVDDKGRWRWFLTSKYPLRDINGKVIGLVGMGRDITDRRLREIEMTKNLEQQKGLIKLLQMEVNSVQKFLDIALEEAIVITASKIGFIYHYDEQKELFVLNSWSKEVMKECSIMEPKTVYELKSTGIWGEAVRQRKEIIVNDFQASNPLKKGYPLGHVKLEKFLIIPLFNANKIIAVVGVANKESDYDQSDVTTLKLLMSSIWGRVISMQAEIALKNSEEKHRILFRDSPDAYIIISEGIITDCNIAAESLLHTKRKVLIGKSLGELSPEFQPDGENSEETSQQKIRIAIREGVNSFEWVLIRFDGLEIFTEIYMASTNLDGKPALFTTLRNITARKLSEYALEKNEKSLREAQAIAHIGNWELNINSGILKGSDEASRIYGVEKQGAYLPLQMIQNTVLPQFRKDLDDALTNLIKYNKPYNEEFQIKRFNDGAIRWINSKAELNIDSAGALISITGIIQDITDRKNAENVIRTNEKNLLELNATKDKFFSIIAHDLKGPFNGLLGFSEILLTDYSELEESERISLIRGIAELSKNTYRLLENLLDWSRIQTGKLVFDPEEFNLFIELYSTLSILEQTAKNKKIDFQYSVDNTIQILADKNMLATVVRNLISNSIKFTNPGGRVLFSVIKESDQYKFSIKDTGIGMTEEEVNKLFLIEKNKSRKGTANEQGTGLGLLLCKEMVEKHGGEIKVESELRIGSTFSFSIPFSNYKSISN